MSKIQEAPDETGIFWLAMEGKELYHGKMIDYLRRVCTQPKAPSDEGTVKNQFLGIDF